MVSQCAVPVELGASLKGLQRFDYSTDGKAQNSDFFITGTDAQPTEPPAALAWDQGSVIWLLSIIRITKANSQCMMGKGT